MWLPPVCPLLVTWTVNTACALTGNETSGPLVHIPVLNPLSHISQGSPKFLTRRQAPQIHIHTKWGKYTKMLTVVPLDQSYQICNVGHICNFIASSTQVANTRPTG